MAELAETCSCAERPHRIVTVSCEKLDHRVAGEAFPPGFVGQKCH